MSGITHDHPRREQAHCASARCQAGLIQIGQITFNDLIRAASDAERRAQAAELRCVNYSQAIVDLREGCKKAEDALTLMLKHYHDAEASAKDELARASELAHELEETKRGKDTFIGNLLKTNEQLRTHLADAEDRIRKLEWEQLQASDDEEGEWVCCEKCQTWRKLPDSSNTSMLPATWVCGMPPLGDTRCGRS